MQQHPSMEWRAAHLLILSATIGRIRMAQGVRRRGVARGLAGRETADALESSPHIPPVVASNAASGA